MPAKTSALVRYETIPSLFVSRVKSLGAAVVFPNIPFGPRYRVLLVVVVVADTKADWPMSPAKRVEKTGVFLEGHQRQQQQFARHV